MSKFTCIVLCVVAASLTKVSHAVTEEEKAEFREVMAPIIAECSEEHGVSEADIQKAKEAGSADAIKSCFLGCIMTKTETLDAKGLFDAETSLSKLRKFVKSDEEFAKFEEIGKACMSVNEKDVSDGEAGCERAKLILACFLEHKADKIYGQFDTLSTEKKWETIGKTASVVNGLLEVSAIKLDVESTDDSPLSEVLSIPEDLL